MVRVVVSAVTWSDVVDLVTGIVWPLLVGIVIWRLFPTIRNVISSRGFTVKAGGAEITVQEASDALSGRLEDLREQVSAVKAQVAAGDGAPAQAAVNGQASPIAAGVSRLHSVLWVDDYPENNAYEVQTLNRKGVQVSQVKSTAEALTEVRTHPRFDVIISDLGRSEDGGDDAGIELIRRLHAEGVETPILVYASAAAVGRYGEVAREAGASAATSSATELLELLGSVGLQ